MSEDGKTFEGVSWESVKETDEPEGGLWATPVDEVGEVLQTYQFLPWSHPELSGGSASFPRRPGGETA